MTKADTLPLTPGTPVYCTVRTGLHGRIGWCRVVAVRPRDGYLRIAGFGPWCPPHNFQLAEVRDISRHREQVAARA